jgi:DNA-binding XRE family transcriptional regulator
MPLITQVAEAVAVELSAATFSQSITVARAYLPRVELADLKTLRVTVVPSGVTVATASRGQTQRDVAIDVAVQKKLGQEQNEALDPLLALAEEIAEHFRGKRLDSFPDAAWVKTEFKPIFAPEHIEQLRTFTSVLTLTFRVIQ